MKQDRNKIWASVRVMTTEKRLDICRNSRVLNGGERKAKRENWADFRISASCFTCQAIQSISKSDSDT